VVHAPYPGRRAKRKKKYRLTIDQMHCRQMSDGREVHVYGGRSGRNESRMDRLVAVVIILGGKKGSGAEK
jgi:hypothetical protein